MQGVADKSKYEEYQYETVLYQMFQEFVATELVDGKVKKGRPGVFKFPDTPNVPKQEVQSLFVETDLILPLHPYLLEDGLMGFLDGQKRRKQPLKVKNDLNDPHGSAIMKFLMFADEQLGTQTYRKQFGNTSRSGKSRLSIGPERDEEKEEVSRGRKKREHGDEFTFDVKVKKIIPDVVQKAYEEGLYVEVDPFDMFSPVSPTLIPDGMTVTTIKAPKHLKRTYSLPLLVGGQITFNDLMTNKRSTTTILDFKRAEIIISDHPYRILEVDLQYGEYRATNDQVVMKLATMENILVKREPGKSKKLVSELEEAFKKMAQEQNRKREEMCEAGGVSAPASWYKFTFPYAVKSSDYEKTGGQDPDWRWIIQLPREEKHWRLRGKGSDSMMVDDKVQCNVCREDVLLKHCTVLFYDSYTLHLDENQSKKFGRHGKEHFLKGCNDHRSSHENQIPHSYTCEPNTATDVWPWQLFGTEVAQQLLFDSYVKSGGISLMLLQDAFIKKNDRRLSSHICMIIGRSLGACKSNSAKYYKRLKGLGLCNISARGWKSPKEMNTEKVESWNQFLKFIENHIMSQVYYDFLVFDWIAFIEAFPYQQDDKKVGYAWNSICLFFSHGLCENIFFPAKKTPYCRTNFWNICTEQQVDSEAEKEKVSKKELMGEKVVISKKELKGEC
jgi:hypothetical protein